MASVAPALVRVAPALQPRRYGPNDVTPCPLTPALAVWPLRPDPTPCPQLRLLLQGEHDFSDDRAPSSLIGVIPYILG